MTLDPMTRLLLVEDNGADARLLREMLRDAGDNVPEVTHVERMGDAERHLAASHVDLILIDLGLPDARGLDAVLRAHNAAPDVAMVVITGLDDAELAVQALRAGAQDYLVKGQIDPRGLLRALRYAVERKLMEQALFAEKQHAQVTLECIGDAVICTNVNGSVTFLNPVAELMTAMSSAEAAHKPIGRVAHLIVAQTGELLANPVQAAIDEDRTIRLDEDCLLVRRDGSKVPIDGSVAPIHDAQGNATGTVIVLRDITAIAAMASEVERSSGLLLAKEAAESADRAKSAFLSRMSHELRTPLNSILGFAQLLKMGTLSGADAAKVEHILKGGQHLLALIDEVLDISRIDADRLSLSCEPVRVAEVIAEAADLIRPMAVQERVSVFVHTGQDDVFACADRQRLKQVALNLLSNGVKYNHPDGTVSVSWAISSNRVVLSVSDTGMGISAERRAALYTPFERLGAENTPVQGTGLGLALSKRLVEAMGGMISVESSPGIGSTFTVELPVADAPNPESTIAMVPLHTVPVRTIVYVEDNLASLGLVEEFLVRRPDLKLVPAMHAGLGLELARTHQPDLILIDLDLPDMPGEQLLDKLRSDPRTRNIPVAVLSADSSQERRKAVLASGIAAYLRKPLDLAEFDGMLGRLMGAAV